MNSVWGRFSLVEVLSAMPLAHSLNLASPAMDDALGVSARR